MTAKQVKDTTSRITSSTLVPIGLVITLLMGAYAFGILRGQINQHDRDIERITSSMDKVVDANNGTQRDLAAFTARLDTFEDRIDDFGNRLDNWQRLSVAPPGPTPTIITVSDDPEQQEPQKPNPPTENETALERLQKALCRPLGNICGLRES